MITPHPLWPEAWLYLAWFAVAWSGAVAGLWLSGATGALWEKALPFATRWTALLLLAWQTLRYGGWITLL